MLTIRLPRPIEIEPSITVFAPVEEPENKRERRAPVEIVRWGCPECGAEHDDEDDAAECCEEEAEAVGCGGMALETGQVRCPCCGNANEDYDEAIDCCMWKTTARQSARRWPNRCAPTATCWIARWSAWSLREY